MLARQHQGMDGAASRQDPETSRRQRQLEKDHQNTCGAPTAHQRLRAADADDDDACNRFGNIQARARTFLSGG